MLVLGIESTCDETAIAVVRSGKDILSNEIASQHDIHAQYGGVFPEKASRRHIEVIIPLIEQALSNAKITKEQIDLIAVAHGPGLMGALLIGLNAAKGLALGLMKPLIGVNHVEAHLYAALMSQKERPAFPCLGVILSGGHTNIVYIQDIGTYRMLGQTVDDAIGEAFDKVAKVMGLPYPGGPEIEVMAKQGNPFRYSLKAGQIKQRPLDFSFSGIKTGVLYTFKGQNVNGTTSLSPQEQLDLAASFQHTVFTDVINKTLLAASQMNCQTILFGGGVTNNQTLRALFQKAAPDRLLLWPSLGLSLDNAAMIAGLGYHTYLKRGHGDGYHLEAMTRIPL